MPPNDILDPNPFREPIIADKGNATASDIYAAVGLCLDRWERCQVSLATIYSALIRPEGGDHILLRSFGMIDGANQRREMIKAACEAYFAIHNNDAVKDQNDALKGQVKGLLKLYDNAATRRNEIAHAVVDGEARAELINNVYEPLPTIWFLVPPLFATKKTKLFHQGPKYRYSVAEINHFKDCFEELGARAGRLMQDIRSFHDALPD